MQSHRKEAVSDLAVEKPTCRIMQGAWCYLRKNVSLNNVNLFLWILIPLFVIIQRNYWKETHQTDDSRYLWGNLEGECLSVVIRGDIKCIPKFKYFEESSIRAILVEF